MTYRITKVRRYGSDIQLDISGAEPYEFITLNMPSRPRVTDIVYEALHDLERRANFFAPPPGWKPPALQTRWQRIKAVFRP